MSLRSLTLLTLLALGSTALHAAPQLAPKNLVLEEKDGFVAGEAEHFVAQDKAEVRAWHLFSSEHRPSLKPDADPHHLVGASGGAYLEALPDTRRNHGEKLIKGENFSNEPGKMAILSYRVHFHTPGRYHVWARTHSTGTEDNGLHVGIDGTWPESGQRMQWTAKNRWAWESKQRTEKVHTGVPGQLYLDIEKAGEHTIQFSMREDGFEFDAWILCTDPKFQPEDGPAPESRVKAGTLPKAFPLMAKPLPAPLLVRTPAPSVFEGALFGKRQPNGDDFLEVSGELKTWHKVTLEIDGPFAHERDNRPNPFTDYRLEVTFRHAEGGEALVVPGYFAADGKAGESSAESGTRWRAHLAPNRPGKWNYEVSFLRGAGIALDGSVKAEPVSCHGAEGSFEIAPTDKKGRDLRGKGLLEYVGGHHPRFAGSGEYFLKAGADAPETFLGYADFDGTVASNPKKCPLKTWKPHVRDWNEGDPTWKGGKGKGMIGAINYLNGKGCNVFSFLPYNAGGDGDNVWPFRERDDKFHYDCSKLDQWAIVFEHGTARGMFLHFKLQETENDDNRRGKNGKGNVPTALDGGDLGPERKLYLRELIARFGHNLALNWNLGEENTQSFEQQKAMAQFIQDTDPYDHLIVLHTYPGQQDEIYRAHLRGNSTLGGASLQNSNVADCHHQVVKWVRESKEAGTPWVVAFDEPGSASEGMPADPGYPGMPDNFDNPSIHQVRKQVLWGVLLGGGVGVEYYFGYKLPQNDLLCEDWRSRDRSWDYCRIALEFFRDSKLPFWEMTNADELVGNPKHDNSRYCFAKKGEAYLVYLPEGGSCELDLSRASGEFVLRWFNPRTGETVAKPGGIVKGGASIELQAPAGKKGEDWLAVLRGKLVNF